MIHLPCQSRLVVLEHLVKQGRSQDAPPVAVEGRVEAAGLVGWIDSVCSNAPFRFGWTSVTDLAAVASGGAVVFAVIFLTTHKGRIDR